ncbi:WD and tetratricopeptide repeats protein 1, partial [Araneus ventricosus]
TVQQICAEADMTAAAEVLNNIPVFESPKKRKKNSGTKLITDLDDFDKSVVHQTVQEFYDRGEYPIVDGSKEDREIRDSEDAAVANQRRMNADPLEIMLLNMGYRIPGVLEHMSEELEQRNGPDRSIVQCRTS